MNEHTDFAQFTKFHEFSEDERLDILQSYDILDTEPEQVFDDMVNVASTAFDVPVALITLVDKDRQWFKAKTALQVTETPRVISICNHTIQQSAVFEVDDLSSDERFANNPLVLHDPNLRFYAGVPLMTPDGCPIGTFCILDFKPRHLDMSQQALLKRLGRLAMTQMSLRRDHLDRVKISDELRTAHSQLSETFSVLEQRIEQRTQSLRVSENRFRTVVESLEEAILITSFDGVIRYSNIRIADLTGLPANEIIGHRVQEFLLKPEEWVRSVNSVTEGNDAHTDAWETTIRKHGGSDFWVEVKTRSYLNESGDAVGILCTVMDISERRQYQQDLAHQAFSDILTGLPNRTLLVNRLERAVGLSVANESRVGLIFIDLDNFKIVNDSLGHSVGDDLLKMVSHRLLTCVRPGDTLARFGGDEFVILLENAVDPDLVSDYADKVARSLQPPIEIHGREIFTSASVGGTLSGADDCDAGTLLKQADIAMYRAKAMGKASYALFDPKMVEEATNRLELESELRYAITHDQLCLHYQPIVELGTGRITEIEALVRWQHPERGLIGPGKFIPVAEDSGLIVPLGHWVLKHACAEVKRWHDQLPTLEPVTMSVNLSSRQFREDDLVDQIKSVLFATGLSSSLLKLEITESLMMDDVLTIEKLNALQEVGIRLAVDDFGTGYSSMSYLARFPVDTLKIDQSFIAHLGLTADARAIVEAMIMLGKALGMKVTSEGIETPYQRNQLNDLGSDYGQGYFYSAPVTGAQIIKLLQEEVLLGVDDPLEFMAAA